MLDRILSSIVAAFVVVALADAPRAQCPDWKTGFARAGTSDVVSALISFDDGDGPALYAGGPFKTAGSAHARFAARWRDLEWTSMGDNGTAGAITSYAIFDSGSGPELYASGSIPVGVAVWTGAFWSSLGSGQIVGGVHAIAVFDDGNGPALYATGYFTQIGGVAANRIAKWDGSSWSALGSGLDGTISPAGYSLASFDDGTGPALYVGGHFDTAGGVTANGIARWKNGAWSALGTGMSGGTTDTTVYALLGGSVGPGGTPLLYAAGEFTGAGGTSANRIASWNGSSWSALGTGLDGYALDLELYDDGAGTKLYAAGGFLHAGGAPARCIARWDGAAWSALTADGGFNYINALAVHDDGTGPALFAGGDFRQIGNVFMWNIAKWSGASWHPLGRGHGLGGLVNALATFDDGGGIALYASGYVDNGDGVALRGIGRWNSTHWSTVGGGLNGGASSLCVYDDGTGAALYAGGVITGAWPSGPSMINIGRWDGTTWSPLDNGVGGPVRAMTVFDDGHGPALYVGGNFLLASSVPVDHLARWDGNAWTAVGGGVIGGAIQRGVHALAVFDDGTGRALYVGGSFTMAGTTPAKNIAKWDGSTWSALGAGMDERVLALTVFDDGSGPALYAGGVFATAGGISARRVARWNGASWSEAGTGLSNVQHGYTTEVRALSVFDDGAGAGPVLIAGGRFNLNYGANIARLDGSSWKALGGAVSEAALGDEPSVNAFAVFDDGSSAGPELYIGGNFQATDTHASSFIARMGCVATKVPFCFGTPEVCPCNNFDVFGNLSGCLNSYPAAVPRGGRLDGTGRVSLASDSLILSARDMTGTTALYLQGTATIAGGAGTTLGDGILCTGGVMLRLKTKSILAGAASYPSGGDVEVSTAGLVTTPGMRVYQVMYRDPIGWCTPGAGAFNFTNAVQVGWAP